MFKRGGFASYTKTGRKMQYGAAVGAIMARGGSKSTSSNTTRESESLCGYIILFIFVYIIIIELINYVNQKYLKKK